MLVQVKAPVIAYAITMGRADLERRRTGLNALTATARRIYFAMTLSRVPSRSQIRSHAALERPPPTRDTQPSWLVACLRCLAFVRALTLVAPESFALLSPTHGATIATALD